MVRTGFCFALSCVLAWSLAGCSDDSSDAGVSSTPALPPPTTTIIVPGVNPPLDSISRFDTANAPGGPWQPTDAGRYTYDRARERITLQDPSGATGTECAAWLRVVGPAVIANQFGVYTLYSYMPACGTEMAVNELTSLAVGLVAEGRAANFNSAIDMVAGMTGVAAQTITAAVGVAQRDPALRAAMIAATPLFKDSRFLPGQTPADSVVDEIDRCIARGGLAYNDWTRPEAGGVGPPAAESDSDYYRCKSCHGWDRLGTDGGYARRTRNEGRANAGYQDPNNCVAPGQPTECTPTRNVSTDPVFGALSSLASGWETVGGRSWQNGQASFDGVDPWGIGSILGNRHPDLSVDGVNASDTLPTTEQLRCLTAYMNHPDSWLSSVFTAIDPSVEPVSFTHASGDVMRGETFYNDTNQGACLNCHGTPDDPDGGPVSIGPTGGLKAYLNSNGKPSELMHKVLWGEPGTPMTRESMHYPMPGDVADLVAYLESFDAPLSAVDDEQETTRDTTLTANVLANDRGEGRTITNFVPMSEQGGTVNCVDPNCIYEPPTGFTGEDQFDYTIADGSSDSTATVFITVIPPPVNAIDDSVTTTANMSVTIDVLTNDTGDVLNFIAFQAVSVEGGSINCAMDACIYTPLTDFVGNDEFSYTVSDGISEDTATVMVTVNEQPPVPAVAVNDTAVTDAFVTIVIDVLANDEGTDIQIVDFDSASTNSADVSCSTSECTYSPPPAFAGEDTFSYTIANAVDSSSATVTVMVLAVAPVVATDDTAVTNTDESVVIDVLVNDSGTNLTIIDFDTAGTSNGSINCTATNCTYTPPMVFAGQDSFTYTMSDGLTSDSATVSIVVESTAPIVVTNDDSAQTPFETAVSFDVLANDVGIAIAITEFDARSAAGGVVVCAGTTCEYTPPVGFSGVDSFNYTAADPFTSDSATVTLTVSVVATDDAVTIPFDTPITFDVVANDRGINLTVVAFDALGNNGGSVSCTASDCTYTPPMGFSGMDSFGYTASDGLTNDSALVTVTVRTAVVAADDSVITLVDTPVTVDVLANDSGTNLTITAFDTIGAGSGSINCTASSCIYTPPMQFAGQDSFTYTASDGLTSDVATVTVVVESTAPVVVANDDSAQTSFETAVSVNVLINDVGIAIAIGNFDATSVAGGSVDCAGTTCEYSPPAGFSGADSFVYTAADAFTSDMATVSLTVSVVAVDDTVITPQDTAISLSVIANDGGTGLTVVAFDTTGTSGGSINCTASNCTYTPPMGFSGMDSFTYTASDGLTSGVATVTVVVEFVAPVVVANDDAAQTPFETAVSVNVLANDVGIAIAIGNFDANSVAGGSVVCAGTTCEYTPPAGFSGTDSFAYTAADAFTSDMATVDLTVTVVAVDDTVSTPQDTPVTLSVIANDGGTGLTVVTFDTNGTSGGSINCTASDCTYTPPMEFSGADSFTYTVSDGVSFDTAMVAVTVVSVGPVGDFETGRALYDADCASCHAAGVYDMSGFAGDVAGTGALLIPDLGVLDSLMNGLILSDQDILDLTVFLDDPSVIGQF